MKIKCNHEEYEIIHRDFGEYILEFCVKEGCDYKKRIYGKIWKELFPGSQSD